VAPALAARTYESATAPHYLLRVQQRSPTAIPLGFQLANEVVRLRALVPGDALAVHRACQDPEITYFTSFREAADVEETRAWIESQQTKRMRGGAIDFGIVPVGGVAVVGAIGLAEIDLVDRRAEVGYWVTRRARRRGFASAALELLSSWAFGPPLELARLGVRPDIEDTASRQTALRAGYEFEAVLRSYTYAKGRRWDLAQYSLIAPECDPGDAAPASSGGIDARAGS
jgi:RimJ/RimL family protein N-acetyltransferase